MTATTSKILMGITPLLCRLEGRKTLEVRANRLPLVMPKNILTQNAKQSKFLFVAIIYCNTFQN